MENLNEEQIKKALECCKNGIITDCELCPRYNIDADTTMDCMEGLMRDAFALIKSKDQRIKELENRLTECENGYEGTLFLDRCKLHDAEEKIKKLTKQNANLYESCTKLVQDLHACKSDTVRYVHAEIKARCIKGGIYPVLVERTLDQIEKEMIGEGK